MKFLTVLLIFLNYYLAFVKATPKPEQKSLVLVFDTTGSMHDDLVQMRQTAIEITEKLATAENNPIYNYIFSPFNDPAVGPVVNTQDKNVLMNTLNAITVDNGGDDCHELSMQGIIDGLHDALPESYVFVFTDASSKDKARVDEVVSLVQKKQATVSFLVTGFCFNKELDNKVYNKIASNSNGQFFDLERKSVKTVLDYVKSTLDSKNEQLFYESSPEAGGSTIKVDVDATMKEISIVIAGKNPKVDVINPEDKISDKAVIAVSLDGMMAAVVKDPEVGPWKFKYSSSSGHSVKINSLSDLNFKYGFSKTIAITKEETSFLPLIGENILTIFPSDPALVKDLTEIKISAIGIKMSDSDTAGDTDKFEFSIPLTKYDKYDKVFYKTKAFNVPKFKFRINLLGYDSEGNPINRMLSKSIQPPGELVTEKTPPDVTILPTNLTITEGEEILVTCNVISVTSIKTEWRKNGITLAASSTRFSTELILNITDTSMANAGTYECISKSKNGQISSTINIQIERLEFTVNIAETRHEVSVADELKIPCIVDTTLVFEILWSKNNASLTPWIKGDESSKVYKHSSVEKESSGIYGCHVRVLSQIKVSLTNVIVNYQPEILEKPVEKIILHFGDDINLPCHADAVPTPKIFWYYTPINTTESTDPIATGNEYEITALSRDYVGVYRCEVDNGIGTKQKRTITVEANPPKPPKIQKSSSTDILVQTGKKLELECKCDDCSPLIDYHWKTKDITLRKNQNIYGNLAAKRWDILNNFKNATANYKLVIDKVAKDEQYECELSNMFGTDKITYKVVVDYPPRYISRRTKQYHETNVGKDLNLDCTMISKPKAIYSWYKDGNLLITKSNKLNFKNIKKEDDGFYTCEARNYLGTVEVTHSVGVHYKPTIIKITNNLEVLRYNNFSLECVAEGNPLPILTWKKGNKVALSTSRSQNNITLMKILKRNEAIYLDNKNNSYQWSSFAALPKTPTVNGIIKVNAKKDQISLVLNVPSMSKGWLNTNKCKVYNNVGDDEKIAKVSMVEFPFFSELKSENNPLIIEAQKGLKLDLFCKANGTPSPESSWYKDGTIITTNEHNILKFFIKNQRLIIFGTLESNSGNYTCVVQNKLGKISYSFLVTVIYPPLQINDDYGNPLTIEKTQNKNDDLDLNCYTDSKPPAEYIWSKVDSITNDIITLDERSSTLKITNIQSTSKFLCRAKNKAGEAKIEFNINVNEPPQILDNIDQTISIDYGSERVLSCHITKVIPKPTIKWLKNNSSISIENVEQLDDDESLLLYNVESLHSGKYACLVENNLGQTQKIFNVIVQEPHITWSNWTTFSKCSTTCGIGLRIRDRYCTLSDLNKCVGDSSEYINCDSGPCVIHGGWGVWSEWSSCSSSCISSTNAPIKTRTRECNNPPPSGYENDCGYEDRESIACTNLPKCVINGGWSESHTTKCNKICGVGTQKIIRYCTNPRPENGGKSCVGNRELEVLPCKLRDC